MSSIKQDKVLLEKQGNKRAWTFIEIPFSVKKVFKSNRRVPVKGTIDGIPFKSSILSQGDDVYFLFVSQPIRKAIGKEVGDSVILTIEKDNEARTVQIPNDILESFALFPEILNTFERFSYSHKKEIVEWICDSKKIETRANRISKAINILSKSKSKK